MPRRVTPSTLRRLRTVFRIALLASFVCVLFLGGEATLDTPSRRRRRRRYLHVVCAHEGLAAWAEVLVRALELAKALDRSLVEPCVRDGALVPCGYGRVLRVADGGDPRDIALAASGAEPDGDATSRLVGGECVYTHSDSGWTRAPTVLPMSAYFDARWMAAQGIVRWHDWETERVASPREPYPAADSLPLDAAGRIVTGVPALIGFGTSCPECYGDGVEEPPERERAPVGFACARGSNASVTTPFRHAGFLFRGHTCPEGDDSIADPGRLLRDARAQAAQRDVFVVGWRRSSTKFLRASWHVAPLSRTRDALPPFNPIHHAAVGAWLAARVAPDGRFAAVQQRVMGRGLARFLDECAAPMIRAVTALPGLGGSSRRLVYIGDSPSPANLCGTWDTQLAGTGGSAAARAQFAEHTAIARAFLSAGFAKLDDSRHWSLDGGILAIRDLILAERATWFFACSPVFEYGAHAGGALCDERCGSASSYVGEAVFARWAAGKQSILTMEGISASWFDPPLPAEGGGDGG